MQKSRLLLTVCCARIEKTLGWGDGSQWSNEDFERLSEKIAEKTGVRLSLSTLKRIWGRVRYDNFPNGATLNALAAYLGYQGWRDFCNQQQDQLLPPPTKKIKNPGRRNWWLLAPAAVLGAIVLLVELGYISRKPKPRYHYEFSSRKVTDDLPN
jgi:hypothetical protein